MATLNWKHDKDTWLTFYMGAFNKMKLCLKNCIAAINNLKKSIVLRCRFNKNLSDIYDAAAGRTNLELIDDVTRLTRASHHHDSRYIPKIEAERRRAEAVEQEIRDYILSLKECGCDGDCGTAPKDDDGGDDDD